MIMLRRKILFNMVFWMTIHRKYLYMPHRKIFTFRVVFVFNGN